MSRIKFGCKMTCANLKRLAKNRKEGGTKTNRPEMNSFCFLSSSVVYPLINLQKSFNSYATDESMSHQKSLGQLLFET